MYSTGSTSRSSVPEVHPFALKSSKKIVRISERSKRQTCLYIDLESERIFEAKNYRAVAGGMLPLRHYSGLLK